MYLISVILSLVTVKIWLSPKAPSRQFRKNKICTIREKESSCREGRFAINICMGSSTKKNKYSGFPARSISWRMRKAAQASIRFNG